MEPDSDLSASLPEPPPPRPAARDAAIEAAMQRFDAAAGSPGAVDRPRAATAPPRRSWIGGPRMGALVTVALVAAIGVPVWMTTSPRFATDTQAPSPAVMPYRPAPALPSRPPGPVAADIAPPVVVPRAEPIKPLSPPAKVQAALPVPPAVTADVAPAPAPAPPPPPMEMKRSAPSARAESAFLAAPVAAPPAMAAAAPAPALEDSDDANIVVTGSRVSKSAYKGARGRMASKRAQRGDWNACTVNDPGGDLAACRKLVDPAAPGPGGRAAAQVADGLSLAWRGDVDGAIAAFDRAIEISPRLAIAWLNRGLSRERKGELAGAIADLDRAVRYAPNAARGYYNRSLLLRRQGDVHRADADADRAVDLDPRYEDVVD
ncbi:MAG: tetratricopeptide repeat protein [Pseudomonadota bacterium]|jgi:hypothetical protein